jgi:hypothetical protein
VVALIPFVMASFIYYAYGAETVSALSQSNSTLGLKIITPPNDKSVPIGNLTIMGTSTDNENSNCTVYVDWNNQKPFQQAIATGPYGEDDYSSWTFTYLPSYHNIINGTNNLTSKLECQKNSMITTKWNSINVTGIQSESFRKSNPASVNYAVNSKVLPQLASHLNNVSTSNSSQISASELHSAPPPRILSTMFTDLKVGKIIASPGEEQSIIVKVMDAKSLRLISGANVQLHITDGLKESEYPGVTNSQGLYNHSWTLDPNSKSETYKVVANVSIPGYVPRTHSANFQVQGQLLIQVNLAKGVVNPGDAQTVTVNVLDATSKQKISGASVAGKISGSKKFSSTTDGNGITSYSWNISPVSGGSVHKVTLDVVREGYSALSKIVTFKTGKSINLLGPPEESQAKQIKIHPVKITEGNDCTGHQEESNCADNSKLRPKAKGVDSFLESLTSQITG